MAFREYVPVLVPGEEEEELSVLEEIQEAKSEISHFIQTASILAEKDDILSSPISSLSSPSNRILSSSKKRKFSTLEEDQSLLDSSSFLDKSFSEINYFNEQQLKQLELELQSLQNQLSEKDSKIRELQLSYEEEKLKQNNTSALLKKKKEELLAKEENIKQIQSLTEEKETFYQGIINNKKKELIENNEKLFELEKKNLSLSSELSALKNEYLQFKSLSSSKELNSNQQINNLQIEIDKLKILNHELTQQCDKLLKENSQFEFSSIQSKSQNSSSGNDNEEFNNLIQYLKENNKKELDFNKILSENNYLRSSIENEAILKIQLEEGKRTIEKLQSQVIDCNSTIINLKKYQQLVEDFAKTTNNELTPDKLRSVESLSHYITQLKHQIEILSSDNGDLISTIAANREIISRLEEEKKMLQNQIQTLQSQNLEKYEHAKLNLLNSSFPMYLIPNPNVTKLLHLKTPPPLSPSVALNSSDSNDDTLKKKLQDSLKENQLFKDKADKLIQNLRGISYHLLGWRIDMKSNENRKGHTITLISKLKNAENSSEVFTFQSKSVSNYELIATPSTDKLDKALMDELMEQGGYPTFLAHVQMNLIQDQSKRSEK